MGGSQTVQVAPVPPTPAPDSKSTDKEDGQFLDDYCMSDDMLGEGASCIVVGAKKRSTGEEFAVKMIDRVETPAEAVMQEVHILQALNHRNVVKIFNTFHEKCFICIIMEKCAGGDLIGSLLRHLQQRGPVSCHSVVHVAQQMAASIQYLHAKHVVHRDIKGDNYLLDREDFTSAKCRIILTDFGTATIGEPSNRFTVAAGTKLFWSPECWKGDYSAKVDIWAMGVVMYGIVSGRFPFKSENDVRTKVAKPLPQVSRPCEDFIMRLLKKSEMLRPTADEVVAHPWISNYAPDAGPGAELSLEETETQPEGPVGSRKTVFFEQVNDCLKERRIELIHRLNEEHEESYAKSGNMKKKPALHLEHKFTLPDYQDPDMSLTYEWRSRREVEADGLLDAFTQEETCAPSVQFAEEANLAIFAKMLKEHNIDTSLFGVGGAKTLEQFNEEIRIGNTRIMLDATAHKKLVRVVDAVLLRVWAPDRKGARILVEVEESFADGRRRDTMRLPGTKKEPSENTQQAVHRIIKGLMHGRSDTVKPDVDHVDYCEEAHDSPSYPGVRTVYRKEIVDCNVVTMDSAEMIRMGLPEFGTWRAHQADGCARSFSWMAEAVAIAHKVRVRPKGKGRAISSLVKAPLGFAESELQAYLQRNDVDPTRFGQDGAISIKDFSNELVRGESVLVQDNAGKIVRVANIVKLFLEDPQTGRLLVMSERLLPNKQRKVLNKVPGSKQRPDESEFISARRILRRQLCVDENQVCFDKNVCRTEESKYSSTYPGLRLVCVKHHIWAMLAPIPP